MSIDALLILVIFVIAFVLILGEYVHRTLAAWGGALTMLIVGYSYGSLSWCSGHLFGFKENKEIEREKKCCFFFLMIRRPPRSTRKESSAASDV